MARLFNVKRGDGRLIAQTLSRRGARREIAWAKASRGWTAFTIEEIWREPNYERWGYGAPQRYGAPWPAAKLLAFAKQYRAGTPVVEIAEYFETSAVRVCRVARELGFVRRIDDPATFERHRGRWTKREDELINALYDEATPVGTIAGNHPRTLGAIEERLRTTAPTLSTRSKHGRFVGRPGTGHRGISPVLEET